MKAKLFGLILLAAFLASLFSIAAVSALGFNQTTLSASGNHGSSATFYFYLNNNDVNASVNMTNMSFALPSLTYSSYSITSGNISLTSLSGVILQSNTNSSTLTGTITIPSYQTPGTYTGTLGVNGTYTNGSITTGSTTISLTVNPTLSMSLSQSGLSKTANGTLNISNTGNVALSIVNISSSGDFNASFNPGTVSSIAAGSSSTVTVYSSNLASITTLGTKTITITANGTYSTNSTTATTTITILNPYCSNSSIQPNSQKYLEITSIKDKTSSTQWKWKPLDEVEIEVKAKFYSNESDESVDGIIKLELYDSTNNKFIDFENSPDSEKSVTFDEGKTTTETFKVTVPVENMVDSSGRYKIFVKVYEDGRETSFCRDYNSYYSSGDDGYYSRNIDFNRKSSELAVKDIEFTNPTPCGDTATLTAKLYNIGTSDEDKVYAILYNKELGLNLKSDVFSLDSESAKKLTFDFIVPKNATEKKYTLTLYANYKYSESMDGYRTTLEDISSQMEVKGSCSAISNGTDASITAELSDSTPKAFIGSQFIVETTVKNTGTETITYNLSVTGNEAWSTVSAIDPSSTFTLAPGESRKSSIYFDVSPSASAGEKEFTIKTTYGSKVTEQKVAVTLQSGLSSSKILSNIKSNAMVYIIILINVLLIGAIVFVIVRMLRKKAE